MEKSDLYWLSASIFVLGFVISVPFSLVPGVVGGAISGSGIGLAYIVRVHW